MANQQTKWSQAYIDKAYERIYLAIPKGAKQAIKERADSKGVSIRMYISQLILADLGLPLDAWEKRPKK